MAEEKMGAQRLWEQEPELEEFSLLPHFFAAILSFFVLWLLPPALLTLLVYFEPDNGASGGESPWFLPALLILGTLGAGAGAIAFIFASIVLDHLRRHRPFAAWVPSVVVFPFMWAVCYPRHSCAVGR